MMLFLLYIIVFFMILGNADRNRKIRDLERRVRPIELVPEVEDYVEKYEPDMSESTRRTVDIFTTIVLIIAGVAAVWFVWEAYFSPF